MSAQATVNHILSQVKQLDKEDQLTLLQRMTMLLKSEKLTTASTSGLTALSGLGSEVWESANKIDKYLDEERQW